MPLVSRLGIMISYDSVTEKQKIANEKLELLSNAQDTSEIIIKIVKEKNERFKHQVDERMMDIEREFKENVQPISEEKKKEIQNFVHEAAERGNSGKDIEEINYDDFS
jgi:hypothetical protein